MCRRDAVALGAAIWAGSKLRALERCIIKAGHAEKSRAAPREGKSPEWNKRHFKTKQNKQTNNKKQPRVAADGSQEWTGCVWAADLFAFEVLKPFLTPSVNVVHLDPSRSRTGDSGVSRSVCLPFWDGTELAISPPLGLILI